MLTYIDMLARLDPRLAQRLATLTGEDAQCCARDWKADAAAVRASARTATLLARAKALADENRIIALALIEKHGEMCACEVQAALGLTHATVSHHMAALQKAGLITVERRGKWAYYRSVPAAFAFLAKGGGR